MILVRTRRKNLLVATRVFVSFDFDHDSDLRQLLVNQSRWEDSPFEIADWSVKEPLTGDWKEKVRKRIRQVEQMAVICGHHTQGCWCRGRGDDGS